MHKAAVQKILDKMLLRHGTHSLEVLVDDNVTLRPTGLAHFSGLVLLYNHGFCLLSC